MKSKFVVATFDRTPCTEKEMQDNTIKVRDLYNEGYRHLHSFTMGQLDYGVFELVEGTAKSASNPYIDRLRESMLTPSPIHKEEIFGAILDQQNGASPSPTVVYADLAAGNQSKPESNEGGGEAFASEALMASIANRVQPYYVLVAENDSDDLTMAKLYSQLLNNGYEPNATRTFARLVIMTFERNEAWDVGRSFDVRKPTADTTAPR